MGLSMELSEVSFIYIAQNYKLWILPQGPLQSLQHRRPGRGSDSK